jgi:hypothetical protein
MNENSCTNWDLSYPKYILISPAFGRSKYTRPIVTSMSPPLVTHPEQQMLANVSIGTHFSISLLSTPLKDQACPEANL